MIGNFGISDQVSKISKTLFTMNTLQDYSPEFIQDELDSIRKKGIPEKTEENLKLVFSLIDLTSLNTGDGSRKIQDMCSKVNGLKDQYPGIPNVGAICVYPSLVPVVKENLRAAGVGIASVSAGFPSSQTFPEVKELESRLAVTCRH